jgi:amidase
VICTNPRSDLLAGRTVALKDNIALAGVRCTNGTDLSGWTPDFDATVATRILDAGGKIVGKAGETEKKILYCFYFIK